MQVATIQMGPGGAHLPPTRLRGSYLRHCCVDQNSRFQLRRRLEGLDRPGRSVLRPAEVSLFRYKGVQVGEEGQVLFRLGLSFAQYSKMHDRLQTRLTRDDKRLIRLYEGRVRLLVHRLLVSRPSIVLDATDTAAKQLATKVNHLAGELLSLVKEFQEAGLVTDGVGFAECLRSGSRQLTARGRIYFFDSETALHGTTAGFDFEVRFRTERPRSWSYRIRVENPELFGIIEIEGPRPHKWRVTSTS